MVNRIGIVYPCDSHETHEEGPRTYWLKSYDFNNKDKVNSLNILSNNDYQTSSQKFRQNGYYKVLFITKLYSIETNQK